MVNDTSKFTINGDVYVRGSGNDLDEQKFYNEFGGILVGANENTLTEIKKSSINKTEITNLPTVKGNIEVNGNVYLGEVKKNQRREKEKILNYLQVF
ncbi:hypothetical protein PL321_10560 [Caloramator sp. mosi_1]|uniref:hypothetical protein n=1 Tax=Caloramator sp. mosi_1 TaxID=3023090 RepID=UPI00235FF3FE|nr:hypothetical protein [Caloramator sp. mosi_1]WDC83232.1 hypothetical protein PL321_10560 [Caloramator sp. mosi_1]